MIGTLWTTFLYQPILNILILFYTYTQNLGLSVLGITILIRLLMTPLVYKQYVQVKQLQGLKPKLDALKEKYKKDPAKLAKAQQDLYKSEGYSPIGCISNLLIQLPILIALYQAVLAFADFTPKTIPHLYSYVAERLTSLNIATFETSLLGVNLISKPSDFINLQSAFTNGLPYLILLVILAISNVIPAYVSTKYINPQIKPVKKESTNKNTPDDPSFEEVFSSSLNTSTMYVLPIILSFTMSGFPAIVSVYLIVQNIVGTVQQLIIKKLEDRKAAAV